MWFESLTTKGYFLLITLRPEPVEGQMIQLSNNHAFEYVAASGALAYDGRGWPWEWPLRWMGLLDPTLFTIVTKTLTYHPKPGNLRWTHPWSCVKVLKKGVVNAIGLTNPGLDAWLEKIAPNIPFQKYSMVCSITEDDPKKLLEIVRKLEKLPLKGIELNASCPNTHQELHQNVDAVVEAARLIRENSPHPLFLKLSVHQDYLAIAQKTENYAQALSINSVPWRLVFPDQKSPLASLGGGGVSGKAAQPFTWEMVKKLSQSVKTPVIGPGVWEYEDMAALRSLGAKAISFGSIFMRYPWRATKFIKRDTTFS